MATMYQGGHSSAQSYNQDPRLHVRIIDIVVATARAAAKLRLMRMVRMPCLIPRTAGRMKRNRLSLGRVSIRKRKKQKRHGMRQARPLIHRVFREIELTTKPALHDAEASRKAMNRNFRPSWAATTCQRMHRNVELTETDVPIRTKLAGNAKPKTATHGRQLPSNCNCRRATNPDISRIPHHAVVRVSIRSPKAASRSAGASCRARASTILHARSVIQLPPRAVLPMAHDR